MCVCVCVLEIFENNKKFAQHQTNLHSMYIDTQQIMRFYVIVEHFFFMDLYSPHALKNPGEKYCHVVISS